MLLLNPGLLNLPLNLRLFAVFLRLFPKTLKKPKKS
jgi:hypothetical protein